MSSRREVLIRILALLQRKKSIETEHRTLKCLKWHYLTVRAMKNVAVLTEDGAFALFFRPHPGGFDSWRVPTLGNLPSKAKKMHNARGLAGGRGGGLGAGGIDWCMTVFFFSFPVLCLSLTVLIFVIGLAIFFLVEYLYPGSALRYMLCRKGSLDGTATFTFIPFGDRAQVFFGSSGLFLAGRRNCKTAQLSNFLVRRLL